MGSKFLGLLLIVTGLLIAGFIWLVTQRKAPLNESGKTRRYMLRHEYSKKGLTEKSLSEGVKDVPEEDVQIKDTLAEDIFFSDNLQNKNNIYPGDNF